MIIIIQTSILLIILLFLNVNAQDIQSRREYSKYKVPIPSCYSMTSISYTNMSHGIFNNSIQPRHWGFISHSTADTSTGEVIVGQSPMTLVRATAISNKLGIDYIHVHKSAGGTIRFGTFSDILCPKDIKNHVCDWRIGHLRTYTNDEYINLIISAPLLFSFVRNPWSRFVSLYKYSLGMKKKPLLYTFEEVAHDPSLITNIHSIHYREQFISIVDEYGMFIVEFLGRVESLVDDVKILLRYIKNGELLRAVNEKGLGDVHVRTTSSSWIDMYKNKNDNDDDEDDEYNYKIINLIGCHYSADIELFGYQFIPLYDNDIIVKPNKILDLNKREEYINLRKQILDHHSKNNHNNNNQNMKHMRPSINMIKAGKNRKNVQQQERIRRPSH